MTTCSSCPTEVEWQRIFFDPLLKLHYKKIQLSGYDGEQIPSHLFECGTLQFQVQIEFENDKELYPRLKESKLSWGSIDYDKKIVWGGSIYKRPNHSGYWVLKLPCLDCYSRILKNLEETNDPQMNEILERMVIRHSLFPKI